MMEFVIKKTIPWKGSVIQIFSLIFRSIFEVYNQKCPENPTDYGLSDPESAIVASVPMVDGENDFRIRFRIETSKFQKDGIRFKAMVVNNISHKIVMEPIIQNVKVK